MSERLVVKEGRAKPGTPVRQDLLLPGDWSSVQNQQGGERGQSSLLVPAGTGWVENDVLGVAAEVSRRWPNLRVASCECGHCIEKGHYPHVVCELARDGRTLPVLGFQKLDRRVVDLLWAMHSSHDQQKLADKHNDRVRGEIEQKRHDRRQEKLEVIGAALKSHKYDWRGPDGVRTNTAITSSQAAKLLGR